MLHCRIRKKKKITFPNISMKTLVIHYKQFILKPPQQQLSFPTWHYSIPQKF